MISRILSWLAPYELPSVLGGILAAQNVVVEKPRSAMTGVEEEDESKMGAVLLCFGVGLLLVLALWLTDPSK